MTPSKKDERAFIADLVNKENDDDDFSIGSLDIDDLECGSGIEKKEVLPNEEKADDVTLNLEASDLEQVDFSEEESPPIRLNAPKLLVEELTPIAEEPSCSVLESQIKIEGKIKSPLSYLKD